MAIMGSEAELILAQGTTLGPGTVTIQNLISSDGLSWVPVGDPIGPPNQIFGATATGLGLAAYGQDGTGAPTLWISEDGRSWTTKTIDPEGRWPVYEVGAIDGLIVVSGYSSPWSELDAAVTERFGEFVSRTPVWDGQREPEIVLHSPLGLPLARFTVSELGFDPVQFVQAEDQEVWATTDGVKWYPARLPIQGYPANFFSGSGGELWHVRNEDFTTRVFGTIDGLTWTERGEVPASGAQMLAWRENLLSISPDLRVQISADGQEWAMSSLREIFTEPTAWYPQLLAVGDQGVAIVAHLARTNTQEHTNPDDVIFEHQGREVRITPSLVTVFDSDRQTVLANVARWTDVVTSTVSFDEEARTVTIHRGPGGEALVTFTFEELAELETESEVEHAMEYPDTLQVLLTSSDGCNWTSQELALPDPTHLVYSAAIVASRLALAIGDSFGLETDSQVWWAQLPDPTAGPSDRVRPCPQE